eukprot:14475249-Alexandrium_andersonii.AAC.1
MLARVAHEARDVALRAAAGGQLAWLAVQAEPLAQLVLRRHGLANTGLSAWVADLGGQRDLGGCLALAEYCVRRLRA